MRSNSAWARSSAAFAFMTSGTRLASNASGRQTETRLDLRGVGLRFLQLGGGLGCGDADERRALCDARAALDRRRNHAARCLGADLGLLVGHQRAR